VEFGIEIDQATGLIQNIKCASANIPFLGPIPHIFKLEEFHIMGINPDIWKTPSVITKEIKSCRRPVVYTRDVFGFISWFWRGDSPSEIVINFFRNELYTLIEEYRYCTYPAFGLVLGAMQARLQARQR
jgi:hypothetical protein